jgi:hypothetical protein
MIVRITFVQQTATYDPQAHPGLYGPLLRIVYLKSNDPAQPEVEIRFGSKLWPPILARKSKESERRSPVRSYTTGHAPPGIRQIRHRKMDRAVLVVMVADHDHHSLCRISELAIKPPYRTRCGPAAH